MTNHATSEPVETDLGRRADALSEAKRQLLERRLRAEREPPPGLVRSAGTSSTPLSSAQQRLWVLTRLRPDSAAYHTVDARRLRGPLDRAALQQAFDALVDRHEALRTTFPEIGGEPAQVVSAPEPVRIEAIDGTGWAPAERELEVAQVVRARARRPFDLTADLPLRVTLIGLRPDEHVLVLVLHHIASDAWSKPVLLNDLAILYGAIARGTIPVLPTLPVQPRDHATWERQQDRTTDLEYWEGVLHGAPAGIELPPDRPRPASQTFVGARHEERLGPDLLIGARALGRSESATVFMTMLAGFEATLARYTGEHDLVLGTPVAGRSRAELQDVVGYFGNTLPLRTDVSGNPSFRELLGRVRATVLGAYAHQELPLQRLVERLQPTRDPSRAPLFQVLFSLQNPSLFEGGLPGLEDEPLRLDPGWSRFDLTFGLGEEHGELFALCEYNTDLFDCETITQLVARYRTLMAAALSSPDLPISSLPILTEPERHLIETRNQTAAPFASTKCLHQLFDEQAAMTPHAVAVMAEDEQLTYDELASWSNGVARQLVEQGVCVGDPVALCVRRGPGMLAGLLGILKAGAAYVPLEADYPPDRLAFMIRDSGAEVLVGNRGEAASLGDLPDRTIWVDEPISGATAPDVEVTPRDLAYVMYTSGSTGRPKGVMVEHRGVVNVIEAMNRLLRIGEGKTLVSVTSLAFDVSLPDWFMPLTTGGTVNIARREQIADPRVLAALIDGSGASLMQATPALWRLLIDAGWRAPDGFIAASGGDLLPRALAEEVLDTVGELWNFYGPTEATIWATATPVSRGPKPVPLGTPLPNTTCYVLNDDLEPVPPGVMGEIWIGGVGVARGYLGRPDLTEERFVNDPFSARRGARLYRTGDLGRLHRDGALEFLGRIDNQVKVRGHRIELGEIESVLLEDPDVAEVAALVREDVPGHPRITAYLVAAPDREPPLERLRALATKRLPEYMRPTAMVSLRELPLTHNGKIDRLSLPAPGEEQARAHAKWVAPRTPLEQTIADALGRVLMSDEIGAFDNFFDLGANSLLLTQLVLRLREDTGVDLDAMAPFEAPTVADLAHLVSGMLLEETGAEELDELLAELAAEEASDASHADSAG